MEDKIREMIEEGFSARRISNDLNLDFDYIRNIIKKKGFSIKKEVFNPYSINHIMELYNKGVSAKNLGIKYGIGKRIILNKAKEMGVFRDVNFSHRIHQVNEHIFDEIDTEEKAYWLGFLYADGYNCEIKNSISLALKETDYDHVVKFVNFMDGEIKCIKHTISDLGNSYLFKIYSKHLSKKLKELGCPQAKSFTIKYPEWLRSDLNFHFIRGYFDGDGSLGFNKKNREWKFSVASTKEMCESILDILNKNKLSVSIYCISKTNNNTYSAETSGNLKIEKICNLLYNNASVYLDRKYEKYLQLLKFNNDRRSRKYSKIAIINGHEMNTKHLHSLSTDEKNSLVDPLVDYFYNNGFVYPDDHEKVIREYNLLLKKDVDVSQIEISNHIRTGTYICKYFCKSFFNSFYRKLPSVVESFNDKNSLERAVKNKIKLSENKSCNFSPQTIVDELKDLRLAASVSIFKPYIAKYICTKYSNYNDVVGDYSAGFGGRLLGAMSCNRKYIGTDPLTCLELKNMIKYFSFNNAEIIGLGSEYYKGKENSIDLYWSSPPYFDLEIYSNSLNQSYNKGPNYFYDEYWRKTLCNIKFMLKPNKWFGVNTNDNKMLEISKEYFGEIKEKISLVSQRYHFAGNKTKVEYIYMFENLK